jgi:hypothetical protein
MKITAGALTAAIVMVLGGIALAANQRDGVVIHNSGSTNLPGYTIKLWSDGSATSVRANRAGNEVGQASNGSVPMDLVRKFFGDLSAAKHSGRVVGQTCMKSASFGSTTVVQYHGWTSPDLECPGDGFVVALASEAHQVAASLNTRRLPVRRPLMPNEPRRAPAPGPVQATPSPESASPAP